MLKRLIGVICVRNGWAVQSIGYNRYLPIGRPEIVAENLDRWFLDEIFVVCIDRTAQSLGPDFETLQRIGDRMLMTPLAYAGGVTSAEQAKRLVALGADRVGLEQVFYTAPAIVHEIRDAIGVQALIRTLPLEINGAGDLMTYDYLTRKSQPFDPDIVAERSDPMFSELMVIDRTAEGHIMAFNERLLEHFDDCPYQLIAFGGISRKSQVQEILARPMVSAVAVGNSLNYRELASRDLIIPGALNGTRKTRYGEQSRGVRQW